MNNIILGGDDSASPVKDSYNRGELDWSVLKNGNLYERDRQKEEIHAAYIRCLSSNSQNELILISGKSGTGKTALARVLEDDVISKGGYFIIGKFDQQPRSEPYNAFVEVFTELVVRVVAKGEDTVTEMRDAIVEAVGKDARLLIEVAPILERILGSALVPLTMKGSEAQTRLKMTFRKFIRAICSRECPLVLVMDDIQWADSGSLDLLDALISDDENQGLAIVFTCRSNEVATSSEFATLLRRLEDEKRISIKNILVENLSKEAANNLVSDVLRIPKESSANLSAIIHTKTEGNVFFLLQFLRTLIDDGLLRMCHTQTKWLWDEAKLWKILYESDAVSLVACKIKKQANPVQMLLTTFACVGANIDGYILSKVLVDIDVEAAIKIAINERMINNCQQLGWYAFTHDSIQKAAYSLIAEDEKTLKHLCIGKQLLDSLSSEEIDLYVFTVVNQMSKGISLIHNRDGKNTLASLCLKAGQKALLASDFKLAITYFWRGIGLIEKKDWIDHYNMCLELYTSVAEAEYCVADFVKMDQAVTVVLLNAKSFTDKLRVYSTQINALGARMMIHDAITMGLYVLRRMGEKFPTKFHSVSLLTCIVKTRILLNGKSNDEILELPDMTDAGKIAVMGMMNLVIGNAWIARRQLLVVYLTTRLVTISLKEGLSPFAAVGFAMYATLCCGLGKFESGIRFGELSLLIWERYKNCGKEWMPRLLATDVLPRIYCCYYGMTGHWKDQIRPSLDKLMYAHRTGLETGDVEYGMIAAHLFCVKLFFAGVPLAEAQEYTKTFLEVANEYKQDLWAMLFALKLQMIHNFAGEAPNPLVLTGKVMDQDEDLEVAIEKQHVQHHAQTFVWRLILAYHFGNYELALDMAEKSRALFKVKYTYVSCMQYFYSGLTALAVAWKYKGIKRMKHVIAAHKSVVMIRRFSRTCAKNYMNKLLLMEAEVAALKGKNSLALKKYNQSIGLAREGNFLQEQALALERAGYAALHNGDEALAFTHLQSSIYLYKEWGGTAKVDQMESDSRWISLLDRFAEKDEFQQVGTAA